MGLGHRCDELEAFVFAHRIRLRGAVLPQPHPLGRGIPPPDPRPRKKPAPGAPVRRFINGDIQGRPGRSAVNPVLQIQLPLCCPCGSGDLYRGGWCEPCYNRQRRARARFAGKRKRILDRNRRTCRVCLSPGAARRPSPHPLEAPLVPDHPLPCLPCAAPPATRDRPLGPGLVEKTVGRAAPRRASSAAAPAHTLLRESFSTRRQLLQLIRCPRRSSRRRRS